MTRIAVAFTLAAALFACRSDDTTGDDVAGDDAPVGGTVRIQDVQSMTMAPGTAVALKGVIVTAIDKYGTKTGDIWVQEVGGGEFSGVHVFGAPLASVGGLVVGDIVDIAGAQKDEFAYMGMNGVGGDTSGRSLTELKPVNGGMMTVTKTGTGTVPAPVVVDALAIGQKATQAERDAEWEKWEGVLVTVMNVPALTKPKCVGSACSDKTLNAFDTLGGAVVESALAAFPGVTMANPLGSVGAGDCLGGVTGVVDYFFDYLILNTSTDGIATGGTGCPAAEVAATCADGIDNDGNGYKDCADNNCIPALATCRAATTIPALQTTTPMGGIELQGVIVTALSKANTSGKRFNMWVQQSAGIPGANESVYVFGPGADLSAFTPGTKVDIVGTVTEFNDNTGTDTLTEVKALSVTAAVGTGASTPVVGKTAAELSVASTGEPYEGAVVTLTNVKVTVVGTTVTGGTFGVGAMQQGTTTFKTDDDIFLVTSTAGTCFATITGIWTYLPYENAYGFLPTAVGTGTGVCP